MSAIDAGLRVLRSSPFIQLQDDGRFGVRHLGVTQCGALDWIAHRWANWLLGNPLTAAVVEITLGNAEFECTRDATLALTGADLGARLDDRPLAPWRSFDVRKGQRLSFAQPRQGARAYLAAPGGFQAPVVLGSCASMLREGLGGLHGDGRAIAVGDALGWSGNADATRQMPPSSFPSTRPRPVCSWCWAHRLAIFAGRACSMPSTASG